MIIPKAKRKKSDVKNGKPNPEVYEKALELLGITKDNAIVFEDSITGCQAACYAGINYINVNKQKL